MRRHAACIVLAVALSLVAGGAIALAWHGQDALRDLAHTAVTNR